MTTNKEIYREVCEHAAALTHKDIKAHVLMMTQAMVGLSYSLRETNKQLETLRQEYSTFKAEVLKRGILAPPS